MCAFNEVHPLVLRPLTPPAGVLVEARPARSGASPATPVPGGPVPLDSGADAQGQDGVHRGSGLKGAALAPIGRNSGKSVLPGCDLRPLTFTGPTRVSTPAGNPAVRPVQGRGPSDFAGGPDVETAVRTTGVPLSRRKPGNRTDTVCRPSQRRQSRPRSTKRPIFSTGC